jgi:inner membrane transporter RhtA
MAMASMLCVQVGIAASVGLFDEVGTNGTAALRLVWAGILFVVVLRPRPSDYTRRGALAAVGLGIVTGLVTICFTASVQRLALGTASALEFLGPLSVAVLRGQGTSRSWPLVAAAGVVLLTQPWHGAVDAMGVAFALAAALSWALYIVLTQHVGDEVDGLHGLAISMPVAGLLSAVIAGPSLAGELNAHLVLDGLGLAVLVPVVPFALELLALRRLTTSAFGTLMSLEPAFAALAGLILLGQVPASPSLAGIALVVAAGIGAQRAGARSATGERRGPALDPLPEPSA